MIPPTEQTDNRPRGTHELLAFSALPVAWADRDPAQVAAELAEALLQALQLDLVYLRLRRADEETPLELLCPAPALNAAFSPDQLSRLIAQTSEAGQPPPTIADPAGDAPIRLARLPVGADGLLIAGSRRAAFPAEQDYLLLGVAVNQAAFLLQRPHAESALRAREAQLRLVTDSAPVLIAHCDRSQRYKFVNQTYADRFGLDRERVVGRSVADVLGPEAYEQLRPHLQAVLAGREVQFEFEVTFPALGRRVLHGNYVPERGAAGQVEGWVAVLTDVTERLRDRQGLEEQTRVAETLRRIGGLLAAELDLEKLVQVVTDETTRLTGARFGAFFYNVFGERGEAYTLYTLSGVPREAFARFPMPRNTPLFGPTFRGEGVVRLADVTKDPRFGQAAPHHGMPAGHLPVRGYLAVPVVSRSGGVLGGLFFGHPEAGVFTERHERLVVGIAAQAAVAIDNARLYETARREGARAEASERHYRALVEALPQLVWTTTPDGSLDWCNECWQSATGLTAQETRGDGWTCALHPEERDAVVAKWRAALQAAAHYEGEHRFRTPAGDYRWYLCRGVPVRDERGVVVKWFGTCTDIDERKQAEQKLKMQARVLDSMTEGVSLSDERGVILYTNPAEDRIFGYEPGELIGQPVTVQNAYSPEENERIVRQVIDQLQSRGVWEGEFRNRKKDGTPFTTHARITALDVAGQKYWVCVQEDVTERRRAEAALRRSEERFRRLIEQSPLSTQIFAPDGNTVRVNAAWERLWGATLEQLGGYNILQDRQLVERGVLDQIRRAFAGEPAAVPPIPYVPDRGVFAGQERWARAFVYPVKDAAGRVEEVVLIHEDITERKQAEEALRASEERLRLALAAARLGHWQWDVATDRLLLSERTNQIFGLPQDEPLTFTRFLDVVHPDDRERVRAEVARSVKENVDYDVEYRAVRPDGGVRWVAARGRALYDEAGQPRQMTGVVLDVTGRKRAEQAARFLADAGSSLASLVDPESTLQKVARLAVPFFADWCVVDLLDHEGGPRRLAVAHTDPAKVRLAKELQQRYPPAPDAPYGAPRVLRTGAAEMAADITDAMLTALARDAEHLRIVRALGLKSYLCVPLRVRGRTAGVITFVAAESGRRYDADDLAVAEELARRASIALENAQLYHEVREADRRKDHFLAILAHELRNPLAPIKNAVHLLKAPGLDAARVESATAMMERQVQQLIRLVDDLLDISRIQREKIKLRKERIELASAVTRAVETAQPLIDAQAHRLMVELPPEPIWLDADLVRLAQVIGNLLTNAAKYTERDGRIWLTARREGDAAVLSVRDTGIGIPRELLPRVFDLFTQADATSERAQGGLGIGLTLVRRLVEKHGGTVQAFSAGPGQGSEFTIRLPALPAEPAAPTAAGQATTPAGGKTRRVLVVDDSRDAGDSLALLLQVQGHAVEVARDGPSALQVVPTFGPDLIFLDIGMPGMDGHEVARRLRAQGYEGTLIALTGWGQEQDRRRSQQAGFDHHCVKPVDLDLLQQILNA